MFPFLYYIKYFLKKGLFLCSHITVPMFYMGENYFFLKEKTLPYSIILDKIFKYSVVCINMLPF